MPGTVDLAPVWIVMGVAAAAVIASSALAVWAWTSYGWERRMIRLARKMERRARCSTRSKSGATSS